MNKILVLTFLLLSAAVFAQTTDSVRISLQADTLRTDTLSSADSLALSDTTGLLSDSLNQSKADTINPIYQKAFYSYSTFINSRDFNRRPYKFTGEILTYTPFSFNISHGLDGAPDVLMLFGTGSLASGFMVNGISYDDYFQFPFDLNRIAEEYIDSAEVIPLPRSFVYGPANSTALINFIGRDFISIRPFSRIRYYQGPYGEGFIDGMFNSILFSKINMFLDITNKKSDIRFTNTDFSRWAARVQLKYILNNNFNFIGGYDYSNTNSGVSGGIDVLNMDLRKGFFTGLYDEITAPVKFENLRYNTFTNSLYLKTLASFGPLSSGDFSVYYRFNRIELNTPANTPRYWDNLFRNKIAGISLNQDFSYSGLNLKLLGNFESASINNRTGLSNSLAASENNITTLSGAVVLSASLFNSAITPSVFYKLSSRKLNESNNFSGYGADLNFRFYDGFSVYAGYSESESFFWAGKSKNFQTMLRYSDKNITGEAGYFTRNSGAFYLIPDTTLIVNDPSYYQENISGLSGSVSAHIWKILLEGKLDYYSKKDLGILNFPAAYGIAGLFYKDSLFTGYLDLKAGFNFYVYGKRNISLQPDYYAVFGKTSIGPDYRLDFYLSGIIDGAANVFFQWENILNWRFFIVPFYPMPPSGIRFGVIWELFN